ncbi:MAG: hypothetical protein ABIM21_00455 [candidate division WOR-3 bacterium]
MPEVIILDKTEIIDRSDPTKPIPKILITFQLPDGRIGMVSVEKAKATTENIKAAIAAEIQRMGTLPRERIVI